MAPGRLHKNVESVRERHLWSRTRTQTPAGHRAACLRLTNTARRPPAARSCPARLPTQALVLRLCAMDHELAFKDMVHASGCHAPGDCDLTGVIVSYYG